jgi:hypothetical protein
VGPTCRREGERQERRGGLAVVGRVGREVGWVCFFLFFQILFKPISNPFKFKSFTSFQIQILTQISPTILKSFHKSFLTTFQTHFKFKPLHKFSQTISQLFLRIFTSILRLFKTTPQPKFMHSNHDAQALIASKLLK